MIFIDCPWCAQPGPLTLLDLDQAEAHLTCPECGTSVSVVDECDEELASAA